MKKWFSLLVLPVFLAGTIHAQSADSEAAKAPPRVLPLSAGELLKLMPDTPKDWTVTSSQAVVQLTNWLLTIGIRNIEYIPPPKPSEPGKAPEVPVKWTTTFQLMDTGRVPNAGAQFEKFRPGSEGPTQRLIIKNSPTTITAVTDALETVDMYIAQRFLLHIDLKNQPKNSGRQWAESVPVEKFTAVPANVVQKLPESVVITKADELHPQNNRQTTMQIRAESENNP